MGDVDGWVILGLGIVYGILFLTALAQLVRIHYYSKPWTSQKGYHVLIGCVAAVRCAFFVLAFMDFRAAVYIDLITLEFRSEAAYILDQSPGVLFFFTYALLLANWADIYCYARTSRVLRYFLPFLRAVVAVVVCVQLAVWILYGVRFFIDRDDIRLASASIIVVGFLIVGSGFAAVGKVLSTLYSGVPAELFARTNKVMETRVVTIVCSVCFVGRAACVLLLALSSILKWSAMKDAPTVWHVVCTLAYYILLELLPAVVLLVLNRRVPPRLRRGRSLNGPDERSRLIV